MKRVIISQPRYLPAINYLQRLYFADLFVFLDNVQRQSRGWENRNKILINWKERWLTIPVSSTHWELIMNSKIDGADWVKSHKDLILTAYSKHPHYDRKIIDLYYSGVEEDLRKGNYDFTDIIIKLILNACKILGFTPKIERSSKYHSTDNVKGPDKLLKICQETGASVYISGANGREYGVLEAFKNSNIKVLFHDYEYPAYKQHEQQGFIPWLSFFDPIFNVGIEKVREWVYEKPKLSEN
ncbi:WbqC family protein [Candidatus Woesearchaeota archaeon]|nr:WbqC family protein [Candidatus Woesearchaeota archaeon]